MIARVLILVCLSVFVSSCSYSPFFPSCPTEDTYEYLSCAKPNLNWGDSWDESEGEEEDYGGISYYLDSYCTDDMTEWLPVLDSSVKESVPEVREYLKGKDVYILADRELKSLGNQKLYRSILAIYVFDPALAGLQNDIEKYHVETGCLTKRNRICKPPRTGSCVAHFESLRDGLLIEYLKKQD